MSTSQITTSFRRRPEVWVTSPSKSSPPRMPSMSTLQTSGSGLTLNSKLSASDSASRRTCKGTSTSSSSSLTTCGQAGSPRFPIRNRPSGPPTRTPPTSRGTSSTRRTASLSCRTGSPIRCSRDQRDRPKHRLWPWRSLRDYHLTLKTISPAS